MANLVRLLAVLGKINPAVWDAIIPHGPLVARGAAVRRFSAGAEVALNPQPLPPKEALLRRLGGGGARHRVRRRSAPRPPAATPRRLVSSGDRRLVRHAPTPFPIPWPRPWPFPWPPEPGAAPGLGHRRLARRSARSRLASGRLADGGGPGARDALAKGAEQLHGRRPRGVGIWTRGPVHAGPRPGTRIPASPRRRCTFPSPPRASAGTASSSATTRRARASGAAWAGAA